MLSGILLVFLGYIMGSIPFGLIIGKFGYGVDVRKYGSKNIGAANVLRTVGILPGILTFVGDFMKGGASVFLARYLEAGDLIIILAGLAAIVGHSWPVFLKFKGGKGVSTTTGVILVMMPGAFLVLFVVYALICAVFRYTSLSAIISALVFPIVVFFLKMPSLYLWFALAASVIVIWRHQQNIQRLIAGTERKLGQRVRTGREEEKREKLEGVPGATPHSPKKKTEAKGQRGNEP
ncbi:MAG: Glycerol-3-phosphate acyltransferase [Actinobacteria bacterium]|nr:Glycerol-3-phosphate acyltransferase [Actinomycetota bacterium]